MKIDRIVNHLSKTLDKKYPLKIISDVPIEGVNVWMGKRIISIDQWLKKTAILKNNTVIFDLSKGFNYFPNSTDEIIFQYRFNGSNECLKELPQEEFDNWFDNYLNLLIFTKDNLLGKSLCKNCLLDKTKDKSGLRIGVHKMVTKVLQKELGANPISKNEFEGYNHESKKSEEDFQIYPCDVSNYFFCPYECKNGVKKFEHRYSSDIEYLFDLEKIIYLVDISLLRASTMTKSNEAIYEIDVEHDTIKEIQTLYNGKQIVSSKWSPIKEGISHVERQSVVPIRNKEDVLNTLKDKDILDKIIKQGLSRGDYDGWRVKILNLFEDLKNDLNCEFRFKFEIYENKVIHKCSQCREFANVYNCKEKDKWYCSKHCLPTEYKNFDLLIL